VSSNERRRERRARELARRREQQQAQPSSTNEAPPRLAPEPETPLASPGPVRAVGRWFAKWVWSPVRAVLRWFVYWVWLDKSQLVTWVFRSLTLLSVGYLVYDRMFETVLTVSAAASDPKDAFKYPFSINNNSHLFSVSGLKWQCIIISVKYELLNLHDGVIGYGTNSSIQPGQNLNITCDPYVVAPQSQRSELITAIIQIALSYDVHIPWYNLHVAPNPTPFTWIGNASALTRSKDSAATMTEAFPPREPARFMPAGIREGDTSAAPSV
jgi:hypothetical protein